jgi:hypothetical protein
VTPQSAFLVLATGVPTSESRLRALLASMNAEPGIADPSNAVLPFGRFEKLHFGRLVMLDDSLQVDLTTLGLPRRRLPTYLALMGECDGPAQDFLTELAAHAGDGLRRIFSHCEGFTSDVDVLAWMRARAVPASATYVNYLGRSVQQVREESALQRALAARVPRTPIASGEEAQRVHEELRSFVNGEVRAGRLTLTPPEATPIGWKLANVVHAFGVPMLVVLALVVIFAAFPLRTALMLLLALAVLAGVVLLFFAMVLRRHETRDTELCPRPAAADLVALQDLEDRDVTNQYTALGAVKPGRFRRVLLTVLLVLIDYACRHIYTRGHLARVQTIHFARWVCLDDKSRVLFTSNYDGSHQAYMDDFINKVGWGLNLVFSNGLGWPRTNWLVWGGSRIEQRFKHYQRRHQLPTQVWYKAYPGLALVDLERNRRIRKGLERARMSATDASAWLRLL